jgi:hypothetical protein
MPVRAACLVERVRPVITWDAVILPHQARAALAAVRQKASSLRYAVEPICGTSNHRLSVYYRGAGYTGAPGSDEFRLGLAYSESAPSLEALRAELETEERAAGPRAG